jgi:hypothetical protein
MTWVKSVAGGGRNVLDAQEIRRVGGKKALA